MLKDNYLEKFMGVILGTAIGDAIGYAVEFQHIEPKRPYAVTGPTVSRGNGVALYSDDTQMMRATLEGLIKHGSHLGHKAAAKLVADEYVKWSVSPENNRAPGNACMLGCRNLAKGIPWYKSGKSNGRGCGTAMRSMAYGLWLPNDPFRAGRWAAKHALMTHQSDEAQAAAAAVAAMVAVAVGNDDPDYAVDVGIRVSRDYGSRTHTLLSKARYADSNPLTAARLLDDWRGWRGAEAVAAAAYCFLTHPKNYREAVLMGSNTPGDSDSIACIVGALSGALNGVAAIPVDWIEVIEKREELVDLAARSLDAVIRI